MNHNRPVTKENQTLLRLSLERARQLAISDPEARRAQTSEEVLSAICSPEKSSIDVILAACEVYGDRPALGYRAVRVAEAGKQGTSEYLPLIVRFTSYSDVIQCAVNVGVGAKKFLERTTLRQCTFQVLTCL